jgi:ferredoxin
MTHYPSRAVKGGLVPYQITEDCVNCGGCIDECPERAIIEGEEISCIDPKKCTDCGVCFEDFFCPAAAIIPGPSFEEKAQEE